MRRLALRLVDCTYLHGAARCLRGRATHSDDLTSFLRFAGELLVSDGLLFTADPRGPVLGSAMEIVSEVHGIIGNPTFIRHFTVDTVDYPKICRSAAEDIASDLRYFPRQPRSIGSMSPAFDNAIEDPDSTLLGEIRRLVSGEIAPYDVDLYPGNATRFVLTQPEVLRSLRDSQILDSFREGADFIRLSGAVRAIIYCHIGRELQAPYLPASSRTKLLPAARSIERDPLQSLSISDFPRTGETSASVATAIDALVRLSRGNPREIVRLAWEIRKAYRPIRESLQHDIKGDALGESFNVGSKTKKRLGELSRILDGDAETTLASCLTMNFFMFLFPMLTIDLEKVKNWISEKAASVRIAKYADILWHSRRMESEPAYTALFQNSGLLDTYLAHLSPRRQMSPFVLVGHASSNSVFARRLSEAMQAREVESWLIGRDSHDGEKLHDVLIDAVNRCSKLLLVCSRDSLTGGDLSYLMERLLEREAREGGSSVLIPIAIDDFLFGEWKSIQLGMFKRRDEVVNRVVADFRQAVSSEAEFEVAVDRLVGALNSRNE